VLLPVKAPIQVPCRVVLLPFVKSLTVHAVLHRVAPHPCCEFPPAHLVPVLLRFRSHYFMDGGGDDVDQRGRVRGCFTTSSPPLSQKKHGSGGAEPRWWDGWRAMATSGMSTMGWRRASLLRPNPLQRRRCERRRLRLQQLQQCDGYDYDNGDGYDYND
jgi:hypothetical protein